MWCVPVMSRIYVFIVRLSERHGWRIQMVSYDIGT